nr:undecaprenyl-diphosphate phosphatase [Pectinatus brassicae]
MDLLQTCIVAVIQGITELFPISSLAHSIFMPYIFKWNLSEDFLHKNFLPFMVMLHLGTALSMFIFFNNEWKSIIIKIAKGNFHDNKLLYLIIVGSIPAIIIGFLCEKFLRIMFSNVINAAVFLILNGILLFISEKWRQKGTKSIQQLTYKEAFIIGIFQCLAFIPGFSRSGTTITGGFIIGLNSSESLRFSLLLSAPIVLGAGIIETPHIAMVNNNQVLLMAIIGGIVAGIVAYLSIKIMIRLFKKTETAILRPFAVYCILLGGIIFISNLW